MIREVSNVNHDSQTLLKTFYSTEDPHKLFYISQKLFLSFNQEKEDRIIFETFLIFF